MHSLVTLTTDSSYFGNYRLSARIATGGMAEVYLGREVFEDGRIGPAVAVKRLLPHLKSDPSIVRMFLNEAEITAQISHPNVVQILDLGQAENEPFIAMELLEGHSFAEMRSQAAQGGQRVPLGMTLRILADACRGLDAAHRARDSQGRELQIVHRDFTPDNIHVGVNGVVKVIDFGIAKSASLGSGTEPGTLKGKFFYMSPEMIAGRSVDHRADLFAAGVMLYEQLCGRRPFTGLSTEEVLTRISEGRPKRPREFDPSVPLALELICLTALSKEPQDRFPSLTEFIAEIERVGGSAQVASSAELSAYMGRLFPVDADSKRQALYRARQADPSHPATTAAAAGSGPPPGAPRVLRPEETAGSANVLPPAARQSVRSALRWKIIAGLAVGGLLLVGVGSAVTMLKLRPKETAASILGRATLEPRRAPRIALLQTLPEHADATPAQLLRAGELLLGAQDAADALTLADAFSRRYPQTVLAPLLAARAAISLRLGKRAEAALDRAAELAPGDVRPDLIRAELKQMQGDLPGALDALTQAAKKNPSSREIAAQRGYLLSQAGRLDEASTALNSFLQKRYDASAAAELAFVRFRQNQSKEALVLLRRALRAEPELAKGHYYLGAVLYQQGDLPGAERAYRDADKLSPEDPRPLAALCELQAKAGDASSAKKTQAELVARFKQASAALVANCHP